MKFSLLSLVLALSGADAFAPVAAPKNVATTTELFSYLDNVGSGRGSTRMSESQIGGDKVTISAPKSVAAKNVDFKSAAGMPGKKSTSWDKLTPVTVQGGSLKTWSFASAQVERVQVKLSTKGRPLNANVDLWQGPDNTPQKMEIYIEDGCERPFQGVIQTPRGSNSIAIRNTANLEFPLGASVEADTGSGFEQVVSNLEGSARTIQGGAVYTYPFSPAVNSVYVLLKTDGRPLNARIELLQGPNNNKQVIELYTEDGYERPFFAII